MKNVSIKHLQLFEDRSDAACRVVIKTGVSMCGMVRANGGGGARMRIWGKGVCSDVARRVAIKCRVVVKTIGFHRWEARRLDNDAARRVATSSEKWENRF